MPTMKLPYSARLRRTGDFRCCGPPRGPVGSGWRWAGRLFKSQGIRHRPERYCSATHPQPGIQWDAQPVPLNRHPAALAPLPASC
jgi:hypothetical protein